MISLENVSKSYDSVRAVDDLTLRLSKGQSLGLLGPNGAGKTTTIRMLVGALRPDSGSVQIDGQSTYLPAIRRRVGIAPQSLALYEELTGVENLDFFAKLYGMNYQRRKDRIQWALDFGQLTSRGRDRVRTYSGGMKRRLNLAVALIHDPDLLVLDEPTVGVDPQSRNHIFECIEQLHAQGRTIIYTTHYMEEVQRLCDQVAIMDQGRLLACDTLDRLIKRYADASTVTAELIEAGGAPEANGYEYPGTVDNGQWSFVSADPFGEVGRAMTAGVRLAALHVARPNLESVFLQLTGRSLRD